MTQNENAQKMAISEFKATCLAALERVRRTGRPILVTRRGEPIAQVIPLGLAERAPSWLGCMAETAKILGDIIAPPTDTVE
jgi:prevent-host-death family protein